MSRWNKFNEEAVKKCRASVLSVFKEIRKDGIRARANFMCCSGCACAAFDNMKAAQAVYWHSQDDDSFKERGELHIRYGTISDNTAQLGRRLFSFLKDAGVDAEWSGNPDETIVVYAEGARKKS